MSDEYVEIEQLAIPRNPTDDKVFKTMHENKANFTVDKAQRMFDPNRGAKQLIGKTIARVDASCVNEIKLIGDDGVEYTFSAEAGPLGIPTVFVTKFPK